MTFAHTHAHTQDPDTSHDAARQAIGLAAQHKAIILEIFIEFGDMSSAEISALCELDYWQVARRISDLKRDRKIEDSGLRVRSPNGRSACVWRLMPGQIEMFAIDGLT